MIDLLAGGANGGLASMGPRSETVVMHARLLRHGGRAISFNGSTVGEPWLCHARKAESRLHDRLQWVHGRITVVMRSHHVRMEVADQRFNGSTVG